LGILTKYRDYLPLNDRTPITSLGEGDTPLVQAPCLATLLGCRELHLKLEGCNPTGSFKDRGMVMAVVKAVEEGAKGVLCASTGNTSASAAAHAARMGLPAIVLVPRANITAGKLAQAVIYGAKVLAIEGSFDDALRIVRALGGKHSLQIVNSINPYRIQGQKTAAFEVCDELGGPPDILAIPVGNAGNITAYWMGFKEYYGRGITRSLPAMYGFQAEGASPIVRGQVVEKPETVASAIRIGNPASWKEAVAARDESGGRIEAVSDAEIIEAYRLLAQMEGAFGELASAASVAGLLKLVRAGQVDLRDKRVVCVITGSGLKDPDSAVRYGEKVIAMRADEEEIEDWIASNL